MFVTIDPGLDSGWALFDVTGLRACGLGDPRRHRLHVIENIDDAYIELPEIRRRGKARPNDIRTLAVNAGVWKGTYQVFGVVVHEVPPNTWKGGPVPKEISHPKIYGALREDEKLILADAGRGIAPSKRHNIIDAVGIGLWVQKRYGR